jgi:hypothetical protein
MGKWTSRLAAGLIAAALGIGGAARAATVQVKAGDGTPDAGGCGTAANPCDTIQAGVDAAAPGDVVNVAKGDYAENVTVGTAGVRLRGSGTLLGARFESCPGDASHNTVGVCEDFLTELACDDGWEAPGDVVPRATSCFWTGSACVPCNAENADTFLCTNSCSPAIPAALVVAAADVSVEKLRVRAPHLVGIGVESSAEGATLRGVRVESAGSACIAAASSGLIVSGASARSCAGGGILAGGADVVLDKNRVVGTGGAGIRVQGARASLLRNSVTQTGGACARADGDGGLVERNRLSLCGGRGIDARGSAIRVTRNTVRGSDIGLDVSCRAVPFECADEARIGLTDCADAPDEGVCTTSFQGSANNGLISCFWDVTSCKACNLNQETLGNCTDACLEVPGERCAGALVDANKVSETLGGACLVASVQDPGLTIERNQLALCAGDGVAVEGTGLVAERNTVTDCGTDAGAAGFLLQGGGHTLVSNVVRGCSGDGFQVLTGETTMLDGNQAIGNYGDGFDVEGGLTTTISNAVATNNVEGGIEIGAAATTTVVEGSRASGNLLDFCDEGTATTSTGNRFATTGAPCTPD